MREPVIASIGYVRTEVAANRAHFNASFQAVEKTSAEATAKAAERARGLARTLQAMGAERVRVETSISIRPLYEQYRDRSGNVQANVREDQIERYVADAHVTVEVRDTALLERAYNAVIAARPNATTPVSFRLDPTNEMKTELYSEAMKDAARRARLAVAAVGAGLGSVKVIDPTGRACETDVLTGRDSGRGPNLQVEDIVVTGSGRGAYPPPPPAPPPPPPPPPPAPGEAVAVTTTGGEGVVLPAAALPLNPPLHELTATACAVYALS
jgi:uncharacterized protein